MTAEKFAKVLEIDYRLRHLNQLKDRVGNSPLAMLDTISWRNDIEGMAEEVDKIKAEVAEKLTNILNREIEKATKDFEEL